jgi:hypothetical protein
MQGGWFNQIIEEVVKHPGIYKSDGEVVAPIIRQDSITAVRCGVTARGH